MRHGIYLMKKIKLFVVVILFAIGILVSEEIYQIYVISFDSFTQCSFCLEQDGDSAQMLSDIIETADKYNLGIMYKEGSVDSAASSKIIIYGNKTAFDYIKRNNYISPGIHRSIFSGTTEIKEYSFDRISDSAAHKELSVSLIGNKADMKKFKGELSGEYGGSAPINVNADVLSETKTDIVAIWILIIAVSTILTVYDAVSQKKEAAIRQSYGEKKIKIYFENVLTDWIVYSAVFVLLSFLAYEYYGIFFCSEIVALMFAIMLIFDALAFLSILKTSFRKDLAGTYSSEKMLSINYFLKSISIIVTMLVLSSNIGIIVSCVDYYRQRSFFEKYKDYSYVTFRSNDDNMMIAAETFYKKNLKNDNIIMLEKQMGEGGLKSRTISANINAVDYLSEYIPELSETKFSDNVYIIVPDSLTLKSDYIQDISMLSTEKLDDGNDKEPIIIKYSGNTKIICENSGNTLGTEWVQNPIIVLTGTEKYSDANIEKAENGGMSMYLVLNSLLIKTDETQIKQTAEKFGVKYSVTNVLDDFNYNCTVLSRTLLVNSVFSVITVLIEILILATLLRLEYSVNAKELAIKRCLGYTLFGRLKKLCIISFVFSVISVAAGCLILNYAGIGSVLSGLVAGVVIMIAEAVLISAFASHTERKRIPAILKDGSL